ncbi:hypothetical protein ACWERF_30020 [Streptomyces griseoluteus]
MKPSYVEKRVKEILTEQMGDAAPKEINNRMLLSYLEAPSATSSTSSTTSRTSASPPPRRGRRIRLGGGVLGVRVRDGLLLGDRFQRRLLGFLGVLRGVLGGLLGLGRGGVGATGSKVVIQLKYAPKHKPSRYVIYTSFPK